jgi:tRNA pseudouridine38-40 synthase
MRTLKLTVQYDGTDYVGWQRQAAGTSIQGLLEDALRPIEGRDVTVHGAGRTDAGVHARGQVASIRLAAAIEPATLARALNAVLPLDVRIASVEEAATDFHARFSATGKVYDYQVVNAPFVSPFLRRYVWHVIPRLDLDAIAAASAVLVGEHDFAAFQGSGSEVQSSVRRVRRLAWGSGGEGWGQAVNREFTIHGLTPPAPDLPLVMRIEGDGFLRHMVRTIAGTLVEIGLGRWPPGEMAAILASRDRARAGTTAPPTGLVLREVLYSA